MLTIQTFHCNMLDENCYIVSDATKECIIIDCGALYEEEFAAIAKHIEENALKPVHLLCTHGHLDHNFGNSFIHDTYGLKPEVHGEDVAILNDIRNQATHFLGISLNCKPAPVGNMLNHGDKISFGDHELQVICTPGHTKGCVCFYCAEEKTAFTGDTLFNMSVGRTDLIGGSFAQLQASLQTLRAILPENTKIYCGHGPSTTWSTELQYNPYLR